MHAQRGSELVGALIPLWYATRIWAEELLKRSLGLAEAKDILEGPHRGRKRIPGTLWFYRTHGSGVDIDKGFESGGIDFDFDKPDPDAWRLQLFVRKQMNDGAIASEDYWELVDDDELFRIATEAHLRIH